MHLTLHHRSLQLRTAFTIARSSTTVRQTSIVELRDGIGNTGFGEVSGNTYYTQANPDEVQKALAQVASVLAKADPDQPAQLHAAAAEKIGGNYFALSALDMAAHDLAAKRAGKPLYAFWGFTWDQAKIPVSNYTLSIDSPERVLAQAKENPWPSYKVKLGGKHDLKTIQLLRDQFPTREICVDANAGWSVEEATEKIQQLVKLNVAFVEQPCARGAFEDTRRLQQVLANSQKLRPKASIPLIADEDCQTEADVAKCAEAGYDAINIKLSKCGGPTAALRMVSEARELGLQVMFGCMVESSFAIGALRHFAPVANYIDLDGHLLIGNDPGSGIEFDSAGRPERPTQPGSGVSWANHLY